MRIYSMTATFGTLANETLVLEPGMNVIQAPNEWGKSTWCAFLTAMLYGLDTRSHTTKTALSEKDRYTPWSGAAMSGRIDLNWNGRDITIERKTKGRVIFGDFRAYETASGLPVPELTVQNCGQQLLGVEQAVFTRSAMIRQTDLPVTQDEALRRRLNALVTTGDDSGAAEQLERRLRELKNRCRYNRTGLLPQAEAEAAELEQKLRELDGLEAQSSQLRRRRDALKQQLTRLENHRSAIAYAAARDNLRQRQTAEAELARLERSLQAAEDPCSRIPSQEEASQTLLELQTLQTQWAQFRVDTDRDEPVPHPVFRHMTPDDARAKVKDAISDYRKLRKLHIQYPILAVLLILAGCAAVLWASGYAIYGYAAIGAGALTALIWGCVTAFRFAKAGTIAADYGSGNPAQWIAAAEDYVNQSRSSAQQAEARQAATESLREKTVRLCQGRSFADALDHWQRICGLWSQLHDAQQAYESCLARLRVLREQPADASAPAFPDELTLTEAQTNRAFADAAGQLQELQLRLGQCQGQMEAIGHRSILESRRSAAVHRIRQLEETHAALELAIATLAQARAKLQRRFAPRISSRAQEIMNRLTDGRYERLVLDSDLTLQAAANDEHTLRSALWRSAGTADLLYLALRLAVSAELVPDAPLILDDALVRFDDRRLQKALSVLQKEASRRQIILFTCHSRESRYTEI